ncbi:MAG TPA: hypothetical protein VHU44_17515 [Acidobacteriaceae bacterium]|jgi:hypothetical protein|nr:hypothetical protein [Acidobacteriaceae bacterium]
MRLGPLHAASSIRLSVVVLALIFASSAQAQSSFKVGDKVQVSTPWGWVEGTVNKVNGNSYFIHSAAGDMWKSYPDEVRGTGPQTAQDRANGHYQLHDRVKVNIQGQWEDGEIITGLGGDYQVKLANNREAWANPSQLRFVGPAMAPAAAKGGQPPAPGMTPCGNKLQGRYSSSTGFATFTVIFNSGKATITDPSGQGEVMECWTSGSKVLLHKPGASNEDMPIDINNDGTLDTPLGEIRKKGN